MIPALEVRNLSKEYHGNLAVKDVSYSLAADTVVALVGPNGAGKTTCFNMLHGQVRQDRGEILLGGQHIGMFSPRERLKLGIARTFQITETFLSMSVIENVQIAILAFKGELMSGFRSLGKRYFDDAAYILELVGLIHLMDRECTKLAYGDLKRVEFAIALASRPRILLLDEPTAGMSTKERYAIMDAVVKIAREFHNTILFTEHDMDVVFRHAERILVMDQGALIADGSPEAVRADSYVQKVYFGSGEF